MISVAPIGRGLVNYLTEKAREDYYFAGGEPPGRWVATSARARFDLAGEVSREDLRALTRGFNKRGEKLVQNAGKLEGARKRHLGISLVFNAPKSWSVDWAFCTPAERRAREAAFNRAVDRCLREYVEPEVARCRLGDGTEVQAKIVAALFNHATNREGEMHFHGHVTIPNLGVCPDGQVRALVSKRFFDHKLDAGAYFRLALEHECRSLGHEFFRPLNAKKREKTYVELKGVSSATCRHFSTRRRQIEESLQAKGLASAAASAVATLQTRRPKEVVAPRDELFRTWRAEAARHGLSLSRASTQAPDAEPISNVKEYERALRHGLSACTEQQAHFERKDIFRETFIAAQGRGGVDPLRLYTCLDRDLKQPSLFANLGVRNKVQRFTVPEILSAEAAMLRDAAKLSAAKFAPLPDKIVDRTVTRERPVTPNKATTPIGKLYHAVLADKKTYRLDKEQQDCVRYATQAPGRFKPICGPAGTSKTTVAAAIADAYRQAGWSVYGAALSGVAAKNLGETAGIESDTLRMTLMRLCPTVMQRTKHHVRQLWRAARHRPTRKLDRLKLNSKSVLILDEASMIGTPDFARITKACAKAHATMIPIGDTRQLPAIDQGGAFGSVLERFGGFELTTIRRQERKEERERVKQLSRGEAEEVIKAYARENRVHVGRTHTEAQEKLVSAWAEAGGTKSPQDHAILAFTNFEVRQLNDMAQQKRLTARELNKGSSVNVGDETFYRGDRVIFTQKSRRLQLENGDAGTIVGIRNNPLAASLTVRLDGEKTLREVPLRTLLRTEYKGVTRGYASTVHKMQSKGVNHVYCLLSGAMTDREITYVALSRHKKSLEIYTDENHAGVGLTRLAFKAAGERRRLTAKPGLHEDYSPLITQATKSNAKTLASDQQDRPHQGEMTMTLKAGG